ncbi:MAG: DUF4115 domain-containing protein [Candidatus Aadella gelida]|nr:DUF4115 domain-containing protein [Candidatus Aadella gelida]
MNPPKELGKIFSDAREKKHLTINEVSARSLISFRVIKDIETGVLDRIGKPYLKSFMKKYATFLGLDVEDILKKYEKISLKVPGMEFSLEYDEYDKKDEDLVSVTDKNIQKGLAIALTCIFVILVLVLVGKVREGIRKRNNPEKIKVSTQIKKKVRVAEPKIVKEVKKKEILEKKKINKKALKFTLKARDEAWIHITEGDNLLYSGMLGKGSSETWDTDGTINVWTGKGEMLDFEINGQDLGEVASGVCKNIKVSPDGVKIGKTWVARVD